MREYYDNHLCYLVREDRVKKMFSYKIMNEYLFNYCIAIFIMSY